MTTPSEADRVAARSITLSSCGYRDCFTDPDAMGFPCGLHLKIAQSLATARAEGAAAEREGCALEAESERLLYTADRETRVAERACERIAAAIRQRGAGGS